MTAERRRAVFLGKVVVSLALLGLLLARQPVAEIRAALAHPRWTWLAAALALYAASAVAGALPWAWLLRGGGSTTAGRTVVRAYLVGLFLNNFLPANVGGDAYKVFDLGRRERNPQRVFAATVLDRLLGLAALVLVALAAGALALALGIDLPPVAAALVGLLALLAGAATLLVSRRGAAALANLPGVRRSAGVARALATLAGAFQAYRARPGLLARAFAAGLAIQAARVAVHVLVACGLRLDPTGPQVVQLFVLVPILAVALTLPITINGIGLRETLAGLLLPWTGFAPRAMIAVEVATFLIQVVVSLAGGALFWAQRGRRELPAAAVVEDG